MRHKQWVPVFLGCLLWASFSGFSITNAYGQNPTWTGILSPVGSGACTNLAPSNQASSCAIDWSQSGVVIPSANWTQAGPTITATGSDQSSQIQAALNACGGSGHNSVSTGQYVLLAAGKFTINSDVVVPSYCELRGAGANQTILNALGSSEAPVILGATNNSPPGGAPLSTYSKITAGATAGSTSVTLSSTSGITAGTYLVVSESNNSAWVNSTGSEGQCGWCDGGWSSTGAYVRGQIVEVESVAGNVVTISPSLYSAYTNSPFAAPFSAAAKYAGMKGVQIYENNTGYTDGVFLSLCAYCWVEGSEVNYADGNMAEISWGYRDTFQSNYFSNAFKHSAGVDSDVFIDFKTSASLIVNNIIERGHNSIMLNWGAAGNVVAYNYTEGGYDAGGTNWTYDGILMHGAHPQFNLIEGNVSPKYNPDNIWGSSSHNTNFRNWFEGSTTVCDPLATSRVTVTCATPASSFQVAYAEGINALALYDNFVGEVAGSAKQKGVLAYGSGVTTNNAFDIWPTSISFDMSTADFGFGYDAHADDGTTAGDNASPYKTSAIYNSYTFANGTTNCLSGGASGSCPLALPPSFFLSNAPTWWNSNVKWPAIGPDVTGGTGPGGHASLTASNAAQYCYLVTMGGMDGGAKSPLSFSENTCYPSTTGVTNQGPLPPTAAKGTAQPQ